MVKQEKDMWNFIVYFNKSIAIFFLNKTSLWSFWLSVYIEDFKKQENKHTKKKNHSIQRYMILCEEKNYQTLQIEVCKFFGSFIFNLFSLTLWINAVLLHVSLILSFQFVCIQCRNYKRKLYLKLKTKQKKRKKKEIETQKNICKPLANY